MFNQYFQWGPVASDWWESAFSGPLAEVAHGTAIGTASRALIFSSPQVEREVDMEICGYAYV